MIFHRDLITSERFVTFCFSWLKPKARKIEVDLMAKFGIVIPQGMAQDLPDISPRQQFSYIENCAQEAEKLRFDSIGLMIISSTQLQGVVAWCNVSSSFSSKLESRLGFHQHPLKE
jgi:hypothetical protein